MGQRHYPVLKFRRTMRDHLQTSNYIGYHEGHDGTFDFFSRHKAMQVQPISGGIQREHFQFEAERLGDLSWHFEHCIYD
jgi:hypothetical protein